MTPQDRDYLSEHELQAGVYEHYKGGFYQVLGLGQHSETGELLVVYVALSGAHLPGPRIRCRPLRMWFEVIPKVKVGDFWRGGRRFKYVGQEIPEDKR